MRIIAAILLILVSSVVTVFAQGLGFDFPDSPTPNQIVTGPAGQEFEWDGTKWIALLGGGGGGGGGGAPLVNPAGGANNYAPLGNPNFTGTLSIGGTAITGLFAPLNNPTGGQNNYPPITSPTFRTALDLDNVAPAYNLLHIDNAGATLAVPIGVGVASPTSPTMGVFRADFDGITNVQVINENGGTNATAIVYVSNGTDYGSIQINGVNGTANGFPPSTMSVQTNSGGINLATGGTTLTPIGFYIGNAGEQGRYDEKGLNLTHEVNDGNMPPPVVAGGNTTPGSRDTFGEIATIPGGSSVTITFARPFVSQAYCEAITGGGPQFWYNSARSNVAVTLTCWDPTTNAQCVGPTSMSYHCYGLY